MLVNEKRTGPVRGRLLSLALSLKEEFKDSFSLAQNHRYASAGESLSFTHSQGEYVIPQLD
jgi:hypothetical protein